ncbi:class I SAM-dependent methyltransferase [Actinomyces sp. oral taxon 448]|uniref:class I SAM-dependent methyltransferase n=1 Tax=Actinomyces sp. oral taxon 448 TaxID=712124 RepID=UPI0002189BAF|nr:class I SAM-dependent methyltransferase [Actinomyces sp. oral taxon 448]EGQ75466.1 S-adenosylmethionine (SAM)-dependent methyltransferase [Actinomyces sp. oral taxon 448 str. F0400]
MKFPWNYSVAEAAPLRPVSSATDAHSLAARDRFEIESVLDILSQVCPRRLAEHRVLELDCGRTRPPFLLAAAGHHVLATEADPEALANMAERLVPSAPSHTDIITNVELRLADIRSFYFTEEFKAVHLRASRLALLNAEQRRDVLERARNHLAPGGLLIMSTQEVRRATTSLIGAISDPAPVYPVADTALEGDQRPGLHWDIELSTPQSQLIASAWIADTCTRLGMTVTFQRSRPDPAYPGHTHVTLAARRP